MQPQSPPQAEFLKNKNNNSIESQNQKIIQALIDGFQNFLVNIPTFKEALEWKEPVSLPTDPKELAIIQKKSYTQRLLRANIQTINFKNIQQLVSYVTHNNISCDDYLKDQFDQLGMNIGSFDIESYTRYKEYWNTFLKCFVLKKN